MKSAQRSMQVWQILIAGAHNRQSFTYGQLAEILNFGGAGVFAPILDRIMKLCKARGLPPITCIVVNQETGLPGAGLTTVENLPKDREAVYNTNWYAMEPVQIGDLEEPSVAQEKTQEMQEPAGFRGSSASKTF